MGLLLNGFKYYTNNMVGFKLIVNQLKGNRKLVIYTNNTVSSKEVFAEIVYVGRN